MRTMTDDERYINAYRYLSQGQIWVPKDRPNLPIIDMDPAWRRNAARWLERRAKHFDLLYSLGEALLASRLDLSDLAMDDLLIDQERREQDPVAWIRTTPLYQALLADLPDEATVPA